LLIKQLVMPAAAETLSATPQRLRLRINATVAVADALALRHGSFGFQPAAHVWLPSLRYGSAAEHRPPPDTRVVGDGDTLRFKNSERNVESTPLMYATGFELERTTMRR
jgi:hypothetical protein